MKKLILASASPRRASLLQALDIPFEIVPSNIDENLETVLSPPEHVHEIAKRKTQAVALQFPNALVLGADTVVALQDQIFEKPNDAQHAKEMLAQLSGKTHQVYTALILIDTQTGNTETDVVATDVTMRALSAHEISRYVDTGEPLDKAGAYGIQGRSSLFIESISGCFYNVVGLPLTAFSNLYQRLTDQSLWDVMPNSISSTDLISSNA